MDSKENPLQIRKMRLQDIPHLMRLKNEEGWNQTEEDWQFLIQGDQNINLVLEYESKVIGSITGLNYFNQLVWIGMMLIDKNFRGNGLSKLLLNTIINRSKHCKSIKLDATPAGLPVYKTLGFWAEAKLLRCVNTKVKQQKFSAQQNLRAATREDLLEIVQLDEAIVGVNRKSLLRYLFENSPELAKVVIENGKLVGFSLGRKGKHFTQIGPLGASADDIAKALINSCLDQSTGQAMVVDVMADSDDIKKHLQQHGFEVQRVLERMYLHQNPISGNNKKYYLIAGPEFG